MPRGGHNIKSAKEKQLNGTHRADRDENRLETFVAPVKGVIPPPPHFDAEHAEKWSAVCSLLDSHEMLFNLDTDALTLYVETWVISRKAFNDMQEKGYTLRLKNSQGEKVITNPAFRQYTEASKMLDKLHDKFGLNMRARMAIKVEPQKQKKESPILALLSSKKKVV
jgi:P27 family predicted phage terminase small subunit